MFFAVLGGILAVSAIIGAGIAIPKIIERRDQMERWSRKYNDMVDDNEWKDPATSKYVRIREIPQMTLERFLTLYNACPSAWVIPEGGSLSSFYYSNDSNFIPYFHKKIERKQKNRTVMETINIPVFWSNWIEMEKFIKWRDTEWKYGQEAGSQKIRDKNMAELAGYVADEIQSNRIDFQKKLDKMREGITLTLDPPESTVSMYQANPSPIANIIEDVGGDYVLMSDGTIQKVKRS